MKKAKKSITPKSATTAPTAAKPKPSAPADVREKQGSGTLNIARKRTGAKEEGKVHKSGKSASAPERKGRTSAVQAGRSKRRQLSTYEKLLDELTPLTDGARLAELSEKRVKALCKKTGASEPQIGSLALGAKLFFENKIPLALLDASVRRIAPLSGAEAGIENFFPVAYAAALSNRTAIPDHVLYDALPAEMQSADDVDPAELRAALSGVGTPERPAVTL
ncbi:MAG: hypothetical protein ABI822_14150, partial [Bryobacteraceae bacterium]